MNNVVSIYFNTLLIQEYQCNVVDLIKTNESFVIVADNGITMEVNLPHEVIVDTLVFTETIKGVTITLKKHEDGTYRITTQYREHYFETPTFHNYDYTLDTFTRIVRNVMSDDSIC